MPTGQVIREKIDLEMMMDRALELYRLPSKAGGFRTIQCAEQDTPEGHRPVGFLSRQRVQRAVASCAWHRSYRWL